jgi:acyl CoA:acetate/3-ketoacid CoA transferase alpha subunit/acyl CoA:acetate/3-ketoacid CoA transferase beta subunit
MSQWRDVITNSLVPLHDSIEDKRMDLADAVRTFVRPGMKINPVSFQSRPNQILFELCRQFKGQNTEFEYITTSCNNTGLVPVHMGLVKKLVVCFAGESYPTPGPSKVVRRAIQAGMELESWTMLTIPQRLMGGAMGVPYFPTRSLVGSTIGEDLKKTGKFIEIDDPSHPGQKMGLLQSYNPDVCFVHAWAADKSGNAILYPPYGENFYGALAAKEGVILTADHIVETAVIREYAPYCKIPAAVVKSVSHVPYGCHPAGNFAQNLDVSMKPYGNDYAFMQENREAGKTAETMDAWIDEWVIGTKNSDGYVEKIRREGYVDRIHNLGKADFWRDELERLSDNLDADRPASPIENMIVQAARMMSRRIKENNIKTVLSGVGQATLMAWLSAHELRKDDVEFAMMAETGIYGHDPRPADPFVFNFYNLPTTTLLTDIFDTLGLHTGGAANQCLGTFGAGEIDKFGNVNSSVGSDGSFLVGSGGANDIATAAQESVVVAQQRTQTFVDQVQYITSPGKRVTCLVSTMGRYEKRGGDEFVLTGYFGMEGVSKDAAVAAIKERCGWELHVAEDVEELSGATHEELSLLRLFDPERFFLGKAAEKVEASAAVVD